MPYSAKQRRFLGAAAGGKARKRGAPSPSTAKKMLRHNSHEHSTGGGHGHGYKITSKAEEEYKEKYGITGGGTDYGITPGNQGKALTPSHSPMKMGGKGKWGNPGGADR